MFRYVFFTALFATIAAAASSVYDFSLISLDGKVVALKTYEGKVLLLVNVASNSNYSGQLSKLEVLYEKYQVQGFEVLAVPTNDFGAEEPEGPDQLKHVYLETFHLKLPVFTKVSVVGKDKIPLYTYLTDEKAHPKIGGDVAWNFTKFLIDRKGNVTARFDPDTAPDSPDIVVAIEEMLAVKPDVDVRKGDNVASKPDKKKRREERKKDRHG